MFDKIEHQLKKIFSLHEVYQIIHFLVSFKMYQENKYKNSNNDYDENDLNEFLTKKGAK